MKVSQVRRIIKDCRNFNYTRRTNVGSATVIFHEISQAKRDNHENLSKLNLFSKFQKLTNYPTAQQKKEIELHRRFKNVQIPKFPSS